MLKSFLRDEDGATAIEYAFIAAVVSIVVIGGLTLVGQSLSTSLDYVSTSGGSTTP